MSILPVDGDALSDLAIVQLDTGNGDCADIVFEINGKHIAVSMFPNCSSHIHHENHEEPVLEDHLIDLLGQAIGLDDYDDDYHKIMDEVYDAILNLGRPLFIQVLQKQFRSPSRQVLHSLLYPETFHFRLQTTAHKPEIVQIDRSESYTDPEINFESDFDSKFQLEADLPRYSSKEVYVVETLLSGGAVTRVQADSREVLCKARRAGLYDSNLEHELDSMQKIFRAFRGGEESILVPRLLGYVRHAENGHIIGLLREWIASSLPDLKHIDISTIFKERREKWMAQIQKTVMQLHRIDVIWGDGKISNVVIGEDDNAWLIDFGGGWTNGWVDEELADSVEGDQQALEKIAIFLDVE